MVVFPSWLQQIGHLLYDSYEYEDVELKNTIRINWLVTYDYWIAKGTGRGKEIEIPTGGPWLWALIIWQSAKEIANLRSKLNEKFQSTTLTAPFILFNVFFLWVVCARKTYRSISMWNSKKTSTRKDNNLFSHTM